MKEGRYYRFMNTIPYEGKKDVNSLGFVALDGIPFRRNSDAITYVMHYFPDLQPEDKPIVQDRARCAALARVMEPEADHMLNRLTAMKLEAHEELKRLTEQWEALQPKNLSQQVDKELLGDKIKRQSGICEGISQAWRLLHERRFELYRCGKEIRDPQGSLPEGAVAGGD